MLEFPEYPDYDFYPSFEHRRRKAEEFLNLSIEKQKVASFQSNTNNTTIWGLSTIFKKRLRPSLSCRFLEYAGNDRNLIGYLGNWELKNTDLRKIKTPD